VTLLMLMFNGMIGGAAIDVLTVNANTHWLNPPNSKWSESVPISCYSSSGAKIIH
jgi:hypothetical protein